MRPMPFVAPGALALVLLACAACSSSNPSTSTAPAAQSAVASKPHYGGTLKIGAGGTAADTILSLYAHTQAAVDDLSFLYDGLVNVDPDFKVVPWLAEKWEISPDGKTYTFHLRHNAVWSDGVPITSADARFEYDLTENPATGAPYRADYADVESVTAPDKWTVVYKLKKPNVTFLANVAGALAHVPLPVHVYGKIAPNQLRQTDFSKHLVTSGSYTLVEWKHDDHLLFASNKKWWYGRPYIDNIYIKEYQGEQAIQVALQNGDVDTAYALPTPIWLTLKNDSRYNKIHNPADVWNQWVVNMKNPILADVNVRKAIMYAYDRKTEAEKLFHGEDIPVFSPIPLAMKWALNPVTLTAYAYDPKKAAEILDADGWRLGPDGYRHKNGQTLAFTTGLIAGNDVATKGFELFQANLKAVGIKTDARSYEFNVFFQKEEKGEFDIDAAGFGGGADPDPYILLHSKAFPPNGLNYGRFSDPKLDALIEQAREASDLAKRKELYYKLQELCIEDVPILFDVSPYYRNVLNKRVKGFEASRGGSVFTATMFDEPKWWIAQ